MHEVVPLAELESAGAKVVEQLLANAPQALAETKALAMESSFGGMAPKTRLCATGADACRQAPDRGSSEGLASFAEKRAGKW